MNKRLLFAVALILAVVFIIVPSANFSQLWEPTVTSKFILFMVLVQVALLILLLDFSAGTDRKIIIILPDILLGLLIIYVVLSRYLFQTNDGFSIRFYELFGVYILYLLIRSSYKKSLIFFLIFSTVIGANIQIIIGNLQLYGFLESNNSFAKLTGSFFNSGPFSGYLAAIFPVSCYILKNKNKLIFVNGSLGHAQSRFISSFFNLNLWFNVFGTLILIPALKSRACDLAVFFCLIVLFKGELSRSILKILGYTKFSKIAIILIVFIALVATLIFTVTSKQGSSNGRSFILQNTVQIIKDHPLKGIGFDRFKGEYMRYQASYFKKNPGSPNADYADNVYYAFNEPLQFIAENGVIGGIVILILIWSVFKIRGTGEIFQISLIGILSISIFSLFSYSSEILPIKILFWFYLAIMISNLKTDGIIAIHKTLNIRKSPTIAISILLISVGLIFTNLYRLNNIRKAYLTWNNAYLEYLNNNFTSSEKSYASIFPILSGDGDYLTDYGKTLYFSKNYTYCAKILQRGKFFTDNTVIETSLGDCESELRNYGEAERAYQMAVNMLPGRHYSRYLLLNLYIQTHNQVNAIATANSILKLNIKVNSEAIDSIRKFAHDYLNSNKSNP